MLVGRVSLVWLVDGGTGVVFCWVEDGSAFVRSVGLCVTEGGIGLSRSLVLEGRARR